MAKTVSINIRIDPTAKSQSEDLYSALGISLSDAINMFIYQSIQYGGLPFRFRRIQPNETTLNAMEKAKNIAEEGRARFQLPRKCLTIWR